MMSRIVWLIEVLLPLDYNDGSPIPDTILRELRKDLVDRFGGITAFTRSPAEGDWKANDSTLKHDRMIVVEIMVDRPERDWWAQWRNNLEKLLRQEEIVVRARQVERL
jgi:hypothetical protein